MGFHSSTTSGAYNADGTGTVSGGTTISATLTSSSYSHWEGYLQGKNSSSAITSFVLTLNNDTGSNYIYAGTANENMNTTVTNFGNSVGTTGIQIRQQQNIAASGGISLKMSIRYDSLTGWTFLTVQSIYNNNGQIAVILDAIWLGATAPTSIKFTSDNNFSANLALIGAK